VGSLSLECHCFDNSTSKAARKHEDVPLTQLSSYKSSDRQIENAPTAETRKDPPNRQGLEPMDPDDLAVS